MIQMNDPLKGNFSSLRIRFVMQFLLRPLACISLAAAGPAAKASPQPAPLWQPRLPLTEANNLVPNSGFELGASGWSSLGGTGRLGRSFVLLGRNGYPRDKFEGHNSLEVTLGPGKTPVTYCDGWPAGLQGAVCATRCETGLDYRETGGNLYAFRLYESKPAGCDGPDVRRRSGPGLDDARQSVCRR